MFTYASLQLTTKLDVYSFGVVLLELLTGFYALHRAPDGKLRSLVDMVSHSFDPTRSVQCQWPSFMPFGEGFRPSDADLPFALEAELLSLVYYGVRF